MGVSFFFVSFNLVNGIVLINVAIAVLLEKMVDDESDKHHHEVREESESDGFFCCDACFLLGAGTAGTSMIFKFGLDLRATSCDVCPF